jgi:hypothetical protein
MNNFLILTPFISLKFWVSFQPSKMRSNSFEFNEEKCLEIDLSFKEFKKKLQICAILLIFSLFRLIVHIYIHIKIIFFFSIWLEFWKNVWNRIQMIKRSFYSYFCWITIYLSCIVSIILYYMCKTWCSTQILYVNPLKIWTAKSVWL